MPAMTDRPPIGRVSKAAAAVIADPESSIVDRLFATMNAGQRDRLGPALRTAAAQLEFLTPVAIAPGDGSAFMHASTVTIVERGAVVTILAEGPHCVTTHWRPDGAGGTEQMFEALVQEAADRDMTDAAAGVLIHEVVERYGAKPGGKSPPVPAGEQAKVMPTVTGILLALLPAEARAKVAATVEHIRSTGSCPAMVGVIGPSSSGEPNTCSFAWPLVLPMAEYADDVL